MKTVRRDKLKRDIAKGLYEAKCGYHYTDDYAFDASVNFGITDWKLAYIKSDNQDYQKDKIGFIDWDFKSQSGMAYENGDGTIHLKIHSNLSYTLRMRGAK